MTDNSVTEVKDKKENINNENDFRKKILSFCKDLIPKNECFIKQNYNTFYKNSLDIYHLLQYNQNLIKQLFMENGTMKRYNSEINAIKIL